MTLAEAIALPIPDDEEGYVLDILDEYLNVVDHLKLKGDRYKELHAAIFGLTEARVWEQWVARHRALTSLRACRMRCSRGPWPWHNVLTTSGMAGHAQSSRSF